MAKTFFPRDGKHVLVTASDPHPPGTHYKVSIGLERWGDECHEVIKVQMIYDGEVAGRRSPSYPLGTDDFQRVMKAVRRLVGE